MSRTTIEQATRQAAERKKAHNPPAFPYYHPDLGGAAGMTMRDYFAAKAMQSILRGYDVVTSFEDEEAQDPEGMPSCIAKDAYVMADAMLKAREA
jgi:hypothetical protein